MSDDSRKQVIRDFRDLLVWQNAHKLSITIYELTSDFPTNEQYGIVSQLRRAAVSVTSNIAEGFGRAGSKEKNQFFAIAHGSLYELESQVEISKDIKFISIAQYDNLIRQITITHKLLYGFRKANKEKGDRS